MAAFLLETTGFLVSDSAVRSVFDPLGVYEVFNSEDCFCLFVVCLLRLGAEAVM